MDEKEIGDTIWIATIETQCVQTVCPVCFGKLKVTLILGDGTTVSLPCGYCAKWFGSPTGITTVYEYVCKPKPFIIAEVNVSVTATGRTVCYKDWQGYEPDLYFETEAEALSASLSRKATYDEEQITRVENIKKNQVKSYSWNAGYHMREAKRAKERLERHEKLAVVCKERAKGGEK
jgi:hypothetical protein